MAVPQTRPFVRIHPTALVDASAELGAGVEIGPFSLIESGVRVGDRTRILSHVHVARGTDIGPDCTIFAGAALGQPAQVRNLTGDGGGLSIGARNIIREYVTIHRSRDPDGFTVLGHDNFLLANCHVAHDCRIGSRVTIANGALLAGCVTLEDDAFVSGNVVIHQFVRVGALSMIGGQARVSKDVPPFMLVVGDTTVRGVNVVGMRRAGFSAARRQAAKTAYRILYRSRLNVSQALEELRKRPDPELTTVAAFVERSRRGICRGLDRRDRHPPTAAGSGDAEGE